MCLHKIVDFFILKITNKEFYLLIFFNLINSFKKWFEISHLWPVKVDTLSYKVFFIKYY